MTTGLCYNGSEAMAEEFGEHENTVLSRMLETKEYYQQAADYEADGDTGILLLPIISFSGVKGFVIADLM